tara:strand:+ start:1411 stop:1977 length:567 start_codon:yes stop_codon:yes gene_type:complete
MTGREIYSKLRIIIEIFVTFYGFLPQRLRITLYNMCCGAHWAIPQVVRYLTFRTTCKSCGRIINIGAGVKVKEWENLEIGNRVNIHEYCFIDAKGGITIGDDVSIAHHCSLVAFDHSWANCDLAIKYNSLTLQPIVIQNDVWIGCGVRVLAGVNIENRTIIAAGAVLTSGNYSKHVYGGVPAKALKAL